MSDEQTQTEQVSPPSGNKKPNAIFHVIKNYVCDIVIQVWRRWEFKVFLIILLLLVFLGNKIASIWLTYVAAPYLSEWQSGSLQMVAFLLCVVGILSYYYILANRPFRPSLRSNLILIIIALPYTYFRLIALTDLEFHSLPGLHPIRYADIILLIVYLNLLLSLQMSVEDIKQLVSQQLFPRTPNKLKGLQTDEPWKIGNPDERGFDVQTKKLIELLSHLETETSFAVGIVGEWGSGKTSFIERMKTNLPENFIQVDFNPWKSSLGGNIALDFFTTLQEKITRYDGSVSTHIRRYVEKISHIDKGTITQVYHAITDQNLSLQEEFDIINSAIRKLPKKLIVFIDDFDRLDRREILETLKIIRNTGNFENTVFIAAYDKVYIHTTVKDLSTRNLGSYIEKIFQLEIVLPIPPDNLLADKITEILGTNFPNDIGIIEKAISSLKTDRSLNIPTTSPISLNLPFDFFTTYLRSYRDINRLCNSLIYMYSLLGREVDFRTLLILETIKIRIPSLYDSIRLKKCLKLGSYQTDGYYHRIYEFDKNNFKEPLETDISLSNIENTLSLILPMDTVPDHIRSLSLPSKFPIYFTNRFFDFVSINKLIDLSNNDFKQLQEYADELIKHRQYKEVIRYVEQMEDFDNIRQFKNLMELQFYIVANVLEHGPLSFHHLQEHKSNRILKTLYQNPEDNLIQDATSWFEKYHIDNPNLLKSLIEGYFNGNKYIISQEQCLEIAKRKFSEYIDQEPALSNKTLQLFSVCKIKEGIIDEEIRDILLQRIQQSPEYYVELIALPINRIAKLRDSVKALFQDKEKFLEFLSSSGFSEEELKQKFGLSEERIHDPEYWGEYTKTDDPEFENQP